jgi:hypothetical protein
MKNYSQFHDGFFEGIWVRGKTAHLFVATESRDPFVIVAEGVNALNVTGFKAGNILFEVVSRTSDEVTFMDLRPLYEFGDDAAGQTQGRALLAKAQSQRWNVLDLNPSYGASGMVVAASLTVMRRDDWIERYGFRANP